MWDWWIWTRNVPAPWWLKAFVYGAFFLVCVPLLVIIIGILWLLWWPLGAFVTLAVADIVLNVLSGTPPQC